MQHQSAATTPALTDCLRSAPIRPPASTTFNDPHASSGKEKVYGRGFGQAYSGWPLVASLNGLQ